MDNGVWKIERSNADWVMNNEDKPLNVKSHA